MLQFAKKIVLGVLVLCICWLGFVAGQTVTRRLYVLTYAEAATKGGEKREARETRYKNLELFQKVLHFVETNYVDDVSNKELVEGALKGMMEKLDPHSNYLPEDIFKEMKVDTSGKFGGLGIEIGMVDGVITVVSPIEDTPAWKAGLKAGDRIVKIDGASTKGLSLSEAVSKMRGDKGSKVTLTIFRKGFDKVKDVAITRSEIRVEAVKAELLENSYGYIRLKTFSENAADDMVTAIKKLEKKGGRLKGLVFDMRSTPGGLLDQAVEVSSLFVPEGVVVSTVGRNRDQKEVKHVKPGKARTDFQIAILVNSSTASAAEIVAGALQDHKRAIVMGQPTFGKGSVQTVIELDGGVGLKLTIARYYTPSGRSIQEKGVLPDILLEEYDTDLLAKAKITRKSIREKDLEGHLANGSSDKDDSESFTQAELDALVSDRDDKTDSKAEEMSPADMIPQRFNPKKDYQVREALNYLKSYEIFKKLATSKDAA